MTSEPDVFTSAAQRIARIMLWIAAAGTLAAFAYGGPPFGLGFLLGAALAWLNYHWLKRVVRQMGSGRARGGVAFGLRYVLFGLSAYVILRYTSIRLPALFLGLFVLIAAICVEIVIELRYARKRTLDHPDF